MVTFVLNKTVPGTCPTEQPELGSSCSLPDLTQCAYGEECCCGKCHPRWAFMSLRNPKNSSTAHYFKSLTKTSKKNSTLFVQLDNGVWKRNLEWILQRELLVAKLWIDKISWNDSLHSQGHLWGENIWLIFLYIMHLKYKWNKKYTQVRNPDRSSKALCDSLPCCNFVTGKFNLWSIMGLTDGMCQADSDQSTCKGEQ